MGVGPFLVVEMCQTDLKCLNLNFLLKGVWAEAGQGVCLWFLGGGYEERSSKARRSYHECGHLLGFAAKRSCNECGHLLGSVALRRKYGQLSLSASHIDKKKRTDDQILDISQSHGPRTHSQNRRISPQIVILGHTYQI